MLKEIKRLLAKHIQLAYNPIYFKTGPGEYAEHDRFYGIPTPVLRTIAKTFKDLELASIKHLLMSDFNEERLLALFILIEQYKASLPQTKEDIFNFYVENLAQVNNWNLVDSSAHLIMGEHLLNKNKQLLVNLAKSDNLWEKRIAIVATWQFIRNNKFNWTIKITTILLQDKHDLIHKACGWMLREMGKKDLHSLITFLDKFASIMPRTMLRYAIEKLPSKQRILYLGK